MIYNNLELNYESLVFKGGLSLSVSNSLKTTKDIVEDLKSFYKIFCFALPISVIDSVTRITDMIKILEKHYQVKNHFLDEVLIRNIKDKEFFDILELTHNFIIPLSYKILIQNDIPDEIFDNEIIPAFIAAEAKINLSFEKIIQNSVTTLSNEHIFSHFPSINNRQIK